MTVAALFFYGSLIDKSKYQAWGKQLYCLFELNLLHSLFFIPVKALKSYLVLNCYRFMVFNLARFSSNKTITI